MVAQATGGSDEMTKELEMKAKHAEANMRATIQKKEADDYRNVDEARDERAVVERLREKRKLDRETRIVLLYFST